MFVSSSIASRPGSVSLSLCVFVRFWVFVVFVVFVVLDVFVWWVLFGSRFRSVFVFPSQFLPPSVYFIKAGIQKLRLELTNVYWLPSIGSVPWKYPSHYWECVSRNLGCPALGYQWLQSV